MIDNAHTRSLTLLHSIKITVSDLMSNRAVRGLCDCYSTEDLENPKAYNLNLAAISQRYYIKSSMQVIKVKKRLATWLYAA